MHRVKFISKLVQAPLAVSVKLMQLKFRHATLKHAKKIQPLGCISDQIFYFNYY